MINYQPNKTKILVAMAYKGFNQNALSEAAGLDKATISLILNGKRKFSPTSAKKIAVALDTEIEEIFDVQVSDEVV